MIGHELDLLCTRYVHERNCFARNKILNQIFTIYEPWIRKLSKKYSNCGFEEDDVRQHIHLGIVNGIEGRRKGEPHNSAIFRNVRKEISNHILRPLNTKKTSRSKDYTISDYWKNSFGTLDGVEEESFISEDMGTCKPMWDEERAILRIDLDTAISKLSSLQRQIMFLWLDGFSMNDIKKELQMTDAKHDTLVYYYFDKGKTAIMRDLRGYECA